MDIKFNWASYYLIKRSYVRFLVFEDNSECSRLINSSYIPILNKNNNIHKNEAQDEQTIIDKYRVAANITEYHIISKLNLQRIM